MTFEPLEENIEETSGTSEEAGVLEGEMNSSLSEETGEKDI